MSTSAPSPWSEFSHDPRRPENRDLRASDRDREVVLRVLGEAFADGRLDRGEYDERADAVTRARTMGELPPLLADLAPSAPAPSGELATATPSEIRTQAEAAYRKSLREAFAGTVVMAVTTTAIWAMTGAGYYWPMWVVLAVGINLVRLLLNRGDHIDDRVRDLEKKQRKEIERQQRREVEGGSD